MLSCGLLNMGFVSEEGKAFFFFTYTYWFHPTDESAFLMSDVSHIPQTAASHQLAPTKQLSAEADMLREDPRDELYRGERRD